MRIARRRQHDVLCDVMLSAQQFETWLTLDELTKLTHYPPASISAQLRDLRKAEFAGYAVEKRQRAAGKVLRGEDFGTVWEYQLKRAIRRKVARARARNGWRKPSLQGVAAESWWGRCGGAMSVKPELAFDVCWVGRTHGRKNRQQTVRR